MRYQMNMRRPREDTLPWYRQFWPWFLISLPGAVVLASMLTIYLAVDSDDGLVKDDYYKQGLAIHVDAARVETARRLGIEARLTYREQSGAVVLELNDAAVGDLDRLVLTLFHPTRAHRDQSVELVREAPARYRGATEPLESANWRLSVGPPSGQWRISGRLGIPQRTTAELQ